MDKAFFLNQVNDTAMVMPRHSSKVHKALVRARNRRFHHILLNVRPDFVDDRDFIYQPGLVEIRTRLDIPGIFMPTSHESPKLRRIRRRLIRNQGEEGSCTGQALAAVIDIQNLLRITNDRWLTLPKFHRLDVFDDYQNKRVSARMLYEMARAFDDAPEDRIPGSTIRNALKGFKQNGVCSNDIAPYEPGEIGWSLGISQAKDARNAGLGAYFRIRPILYDYHAALNEVDAILVSAMIHEGWRQSRKKVTDPLIELQGQKCQKIPYDNATDVPLVGGHAFAIIGYTDTGFLVFNSWGHNWGTWRESGTSENQGIPGIKLWSYEDWQDNVLDAWVFRLSVPSPKAFALTGGFGRDINPITGRHYTNTQRFLVNGHYINLREGKFVKTGTYPNSKKTFIETHHLLHNRLSHCGKSERRYTDILIAFHSGLETIDSGIHIAASVVDDLKKQNIYPFFVFWNYGLISQVENLISANLLTIEKRSFSSPEAKERLIEKYLQEYKGYFWDRLRQNVIAAAGHLEQSIDTLNNIDLYKAIYPLVTIAMQHPGVNLHFVAHSDGAFLLNNAIKNLVKMIETSSDLDISSFVNACRTITLISPLTRKADIKSIENVAKQWRGVELNRKIVIVTSQRSDEQHEHTGAYKRAYAELAQNVYFPSYRRDEHQIILGLHDNARKVKRSPYYSHVVCPDTGPAEIRSHFGMIRNPALLNLLFNHMIGGSIGELIDIVSPERLL